MAKSKLRVTLKKRSTPKTGTGSFYNDSVIAARRFDPRVACLRPEHCYYSQGCGGPIYLVIDPEASDHELSAMATKMNLPLPKMVAFRDTRVV